MTHPHVSSRFCMHCGQRLASAVPEGDTRTRLVCLDCSFVHYINPRPVAGVIPVDSQGRVLLVQRAIEPRRGMWVFPGGFVDYGESAEEAAVRETMEEACLQVGPLRLVGVYSRKEAGVVLVAYEAAALGDGGPGHESLDARWFAPVDIPWAELAFETTEAALRDWLAGAEAGQPSGRR